MPGEGACLISPQGPHKRCETFQVWEPKPRGFMGHDRWPHHTGHSTVLWPGPPACPWLPPPSSPLSDSFLLYGFLKVGQDHQTEDSRMRYENLTQEAYGASSVLMSLQQLNTGLISGTLSPFHNIFFSFGTILLFFLKRGVPVAFHPFPLSVLRSPPSPAMSCHSRRHDLDKGEPILCVSCVRNFS